MAVPILLYDLADQFHTLAPWNWMDETQMVGLRHPVTGELAHVGVMGGAGEHCCLVIYLGEEALHRFNLLQIDSVAEEPELAPEDLGMIILGARQLQVTFSVKDDLFPDEVAAIKKLGRKYRGNWPAFRSYHPGRVATHILTDEEYLWIEIALRQLPEVALLMKNDFSAIYRANESGIGLDLLVRECEEGVWRSGWTREDRGTYQIPTPEPDAFLAGRAERLPAGNPVETLFFLLPSPIAVSETDLIYGHLLFTVDSITGFVREPEVASVESCTYEEMLDSVPDLFLQQCLDAGEKPSAIRTGSVITARLLEKAAGALGVPIEWTEELPALDEALDGMNGFTGG